MTTAKTKVPSKENFLYGGQAVIEGVMIRGRSHAAIAVRNQAGEIETRSIRLDGWTNGRAREIPLVRGIAVLIETVVVGIKALTASAEIAAVEPDEKPEPIPPAGIAAMLLLAFGLAIVVFFLIPLFISRGLEIAGASAFAANVIEGFFRLAIFVGYLWAVGKMRDIGRLFEYHGAEHMAVSAQEHGVGLVVERLRGFPTAHPRCGTAFLLTVILVSIVVFMLVPRDPVWLLVSSRIFLVPVIAALSYEIIRFTGRHRSNPWVRMMDAPNLLVQRLTTRTPDDSQIEVAIRAVEYAKELDAGEIEGKTLIADDERRQDVAEPRL
jgi:hypothetical protein